MVSLYISHKCALYQQVLLSVCRIIFYSMRLDSISFSMFCLHGAKAKDKTPRFDTLQKWRHPQCESGEWGSGTWYPLDVAPGDETEHIIAQASVTTLSFHSSKR